MPVPFQRILAAVDLSDSSRSALRLAFDLAALHRSRLDVLFVATRDDDVTAVQRELLQLIQALRPEVPLDVQPLLETGEPPQRIVAAAAERSSDVIVLGTHGRTGRARSLAGSVAESVVRTAACPVITVR